jgi:NAD(P)-dependent dehydrogenase (short-subunit alcohol dehydrogenase family)
MKFTISETIPRAALVTGGAQQLAMVRVLAGAGFAVALQCQPGGEVSPEVTAMLLEADLADETQTTSLLARATAALGPIGVLVNAAGALGRDAWDDATRATWDMHIETNLRAPFVLIQHFAKALPVQFEGVVINLLDQRLCPHLVSYTLSKAALWSLTQTMALALAPRIRVNGIVAGRAVGAARDQAVRRPDSGAGSEEMGRAALAILALSSMTGQMIVPEGTPPPAS